nr:hypothetical protein [Bacteroidota bacterium]
MFAASTLRAIIFRSPVIKQIKARGQLFNFHDDNFGDIGITQAEGNSFFIFDRSAK